MVPRGQWELWWRRHPIAAEIKSAGRKCRRRYSGTSGATVLGDMLAAQGYRQVIMFGSEGEFAGRKQYFEGHGNYEVKDLAYAHQNGLVPPGYRVVGI